VLIAYERGTIERAALDADELAIAGCPSLNTGPGSSLLTARSAQPIARALAASAVDVLEYTEATAACHAG